MMKISINDTFITDNSKDCISGCYFLSTTANAKFKDEAVKNSAKVIDVAQAKELLGVDDKIKIVGITGTNGKTTTAFCIYETLLRLGKKVGLSGTSGAFINGERIDEKGLTTSEILRTLGYLSKASLSGCEYFVMEVSSHAIAQKRIEGLDFALKIFTNLSQDHLDFHTSMEEYARVKNSFFDDESMKLVNIDDEWIKFNQKNAYAYSLKKPATFSPVAYGLKGGIDAVIKTPLKEAMLSSFLQGEFNLYNLIAALGAICLLEKPNLNLLSEAMGEFRGVAGRMQIVSQKPLVIVDFAHTPDGIKNVLNSLRHLSLVVVFGAGGDRDRTKRPIMGQIAQRYARFCVVTSDNPRSEDPNLIIDEICKEMNMQNVIKLPDRKEAIRFGLNELRDGEALVILGKGDENYQEINGVKTPFSDELVVKDILGKENR